MPPDRRDDGGRGSGTVEFIRSLLERLAALDADEETERVGNQTSRSGPFEVDVNYRIGIGLGSLGDPATVPSSDRDASENQRPHVAVRREGDGYRVVVDVPVEPTGAVTADVDRDTGETVLLVDGAPVERVALDGDLVVEDLRVNNRVVTVTLGRLSRDENSPGADESAAESTDRIDEVNESSGRPTEPDESEEDDP